MNASWPLTRTAEFHALAGQGDVLADGPAVVDGRPIGGARDLRGATGGTAFATLDAPDLSKDGELLDSYDLVDVAEARYVRRELHAGPDGLEVLAFGTHSPGHGEMVDDADVR